MKGLSAVVLIYLVTGRGLNCEIVSDPQTLSGLRFQYSSHGLITDAIRWEASMVARLSGEPLIHLVATSIEDGITEAEAAEDRAFQNGLGERVP